MVRRRNALVAEMDAALAPYDALVCPTTPIVAPKIATVLESLDAFMPRTLMLIRNTFVANLFDLCSITLPIASRGLPVGIMFTGRHMHDARLLALAAGVERLSDKA